MTGGDSGRGRGRGGGRGGGRFGGGRGETRRCYVCQQVGHLAKSCPQKARAHVLEAQEEQSSKNDQQG